VEDLYRDAGLSIELGASVGAVSKSKSGVSIAYKTAQGKESKLECDRLIVSIGRVPNTEGLGADKVGLRIDEKGFVESTRIAGRACRASMRSATWCAGRCSRTRERTRA
jgi:dihydrolipoamide dehydrogenase